MMTSIDFFLWRALSVVPWGIYIDKYGRKAGLRYSLLSVSTILVLYGVYQNDILRILQRLMNGLLVITKVLSTEIANDNQKSWSISIITSSWIFGFVCGPLIGYMIPFALRN